MLMSAAENLGRSEYIQNLKDTKLEEHWWSVVAFWPSCVAPPNFKKISAKVFRNGRAFPSPHDNLDQLRQSTLR